jgi:DNA-binding IclR family transcriptional regulator
MATRRNGTEPDPERLHSVRRALAVLEALATRPEGATPKELSLALGIHLSTGYRLLNTLVAAGYVARDPDGLFRLGSRVAYLHHGYLAARCPPPEALPFVHALQLATSETAMLHQLEGDDVVTTAGVAGSRPGAIPPGYVGLAMPAHATAAGRVLLAALPTCQLEAFLGRRVAAPESPLPLISSEALRAELEHIRQVGYALDQGDNYHDICCIAAPVIAGSGEVEAAIAIVAPCARFRQEEPALVTAILAVARAIGELRSAGSERETGIDGNHRDAEATAQAAFDAALAELTEAMSRVG